MAQLFGKAKSTINEYIKNIFKEGELVEEQVMRKFGNSEFSIKPTYYYNLDVIISVGYRVKSLRGTQFRIWATQRLWNSPSAGGCALPYGKRVGVPAVDRLTIVSHDRFQEIIDHANDLNSIIRTGVVIGKDIGWLPEVITLTRLSQR